MKKVSVIIPVYNVAPYLNRCIDSVLAQTYKEWEIILIDDGSTDESPSICDNYGKMNKQIIVVHQKNAGLSAARNTGIDMATGNFIMFVDSDDWIHPKYIETLLSTMIINHSKMVIGEKKRCSKILPFEEHNQVAINIKKEEAIPRMLKGEWISAWGKLYEIDLFKNIRFPEGRNNEDYAILLYLFEQCEHITYTKNIVYYYFIREGSITNASLNLHSFDEVTNGEEVWNYCKMKYPQWSDLALFNLTASIIKLTSQCVENNMFISQYENMRCFILKYKKEILTNPVLKFKYKPFIWSLLAGRKSHKTFINLFKLYKK